MPDALRARLSFLPLFTIAFSMGICLAKYVHIPFLLLYTLAWILLILAFIFISRKNPTLILILAVLLGGLFLTNTYILPYPHIRNFTFYKSEPVIIRGVVTDFPQIKLDSSSFVLTARELTWAGKIYSVCGKVQVKIFSKTDIAYADQLILQGRLFRPYQAESSRFSYRDYLENQGIYSILTISKNKPIEYLGSSKASPFKLLAYKIRYKAAGLLFKNLPLTQAGILSAMILGERTRIPGHLRRLFAQTGTMHILAISGLHVGIVFFSLELFLRALRLRRKRRYLLIIAWIIFYCYLTGARPSAIRAGIMAIVLLTGFLLRKEVQMSYSLSLAALIILLINPRQLFNLGFQLSFVSILSIIYISPIIKNLCNLKFNLRNNQFLKFIFSAFSLSSAAWLGTLPFIAYYFKIITPAAILANLVVVPYLALVIALGFSLLLCAISFPVLTPVFAASANLAVVFLIQIVKFFNQMPGAYFYL